MGLISTIKSALGLDGSTDGSDGTDVTVEREADAGSERAVKESGPDAAGTTGQSETEATEEETEPPGGETASTESESPAVESPGADAPAEGGGDPVEEIKGIGPAYADRLGEAGIDTVSDLAAADAADLAEATGIGESRLSKWIQRAEAR